MSSFCNTRCFPITSATTPLVAIFWESSQGIVFVRAPFLHEVGRSRTRMRSMLQYLCVYAYQPGGVQTEERQRKTKIATTAAVSSTTPPPPPPPAQLVTQGDAHASFSPVISFGLSPGARGRKHKKKTPTPTIYQSDEARQTNTIYTEESEKDGQTNLLELVQRSRPNHSQQEKPASFVIRSTKGRGRRALLPGKK